MLIIGRELRIALLVLLMVGPAGAQASTSGAGIFVADCGAHRIVRMDDMTGAGWTALGSGTNQFAVPASVFVDTAGRGRAEAIHCQPWPEGASARHVYSDLTVVH